MNAITRGWTTALAALALVIGLSGCQFQEDADRHFGDQHFKTAIALIELHKLRTGHYPAALSELEFTGAWDAGALASVSYRLQGEGYALDLTRGWAGRPDLAYPPAFWNGLGIVASNVGGVPTRH